MPSLTPTSAGSAFSAAAASRVAVAQRDQRLQDVGLRVAGDASPARRVGAELALELEQQPLGGLLADARYLDQPAAFLQR